MKKISFEIAKEDNAVKLFLNRCKALMRLLRKMSSKGMNFLFGKELKFEGSAAIEKEIKDKQSNEKVFQNDIGKTK
ncbi:MAG: hypothetical protein ACKOXB_02570 [Flavobacteriales bacterium]